MVRGINEGVFLEWCWGRDGEKNVVGGVVVCRVIGRGVEEDSEDMVEREGDVVMMVVGIRGESGVVV